jgi:hypothetical protein
MIDHEEIYGAEAEGYDLLVSREDYQGHVLPALREIRAVLRGGGSPNGSSPGQLNPILYAQKAV